MRLKSLSVKELLFNRRPFGEGQSQDAFRRQTAVEGTFDLATRLNGELRGDMAQKQKANFGDRNPLPFAMADLGVSHHFCHSQNCQNSDTQAFVWGHHRMTGMI